MPGKTISNLSVSLFGDVSNFANAFGKKATGAVKDFGSSLGGIGKMAGTLAAAAGIMELLHKAVDEMAKGFKLAAQFEQTNIQLTAMLGSAEKARGVLTDLRRFAADSPFELPDLTHSVRQLAAFGIATEDLMPTLNMLGSIASGSGASLQELTELYIRVREEGALSNRELREFTTAGVPLVSALAKALGKTPQEIHRMLQEGQVTFPQLQKAFIQLTSSGGAFNNMLQQQRNTLGGAWARLMHSTDEMLAKVAEGFLDGFDVKPVLNGLADLMNVIGEIGYAVGKLVGMGIDGIKMMGGWVIDLAKKVGVLNEGIQWLVKSWDFLKGEALANLKPPKIEKPQPLDVDVHPHVGGHELVKWGSAEMKAIQAQWAAEMGPKKKTLADHAKAAAHPASTQTTASLNALKWGMLAQKAGRFGDLMKWYQSHHHPLGRKNSSLDERMESLRNNGFFSADKENTWVDSHGVRHKQKDTPWHQQDWRMDPSKVLTPDNIKQHLSPQPPNGIKVNPDQVSWKADDVYKTTDYLFKIWQNTQPNNQQVADFSGVA